MANNVVAIANCGTMGNVGGGGSGNSTDPTDDGKAPVDDIFDPNDPTDEAKCEVATDIVDTLVLRYQQGAETFVGNMVTSYLDQSAMTDVIGGFAVDVAVETYDTLSDWLPKSVVETLGSVAVSSYLFFQEEFEDLGYYLADSEEQFRAVMFSGRTALICALYAGQNETESRENFYETLNGLMGAAIASENYTVGTEDLTDHGNTYEHIPDFHYNSLDPLIEELVPRLFGTLADYSSDKVVDCSACNSSGNGGNASGEVEERTMVRLTFAQSTASWTVDAGHRSFQVLVQGATTDITNDTVLSPATGVKWNFQSQDGLSFEAPLPAVIEAVPRLTFDSTQPLEILSQRGAGGRDTVYTFDIGQAGIIEIGNGNKLALEAQSTYGGPTLYLQEIEFFNES